MQRYKKIILQKKIVNKNFLNRSRSISPVSKFINRFKKFNPFQLGNIVEEIGEDDENARLMQIRTKK